MAWPKIKQIKIAFAALMIIVLFGLIFIVYRAKTQSNPKYIVQIKDITISAEVVTSPWRQYLGLSNRESLCASCGMLFVFPFPEEQDFVMRNMNFPLDIIFVADNKIINIEENLMPEGAKPAQVYRSAGPADMVLEVPANYCKQNGIIPGDSLMIRPN